MGRTIRKGLGKMFNVNDIVFYGAQGVCRINGIIEKNLDGKKLNYYELKPVFDDCITIYAPIENENAPVKLRRVLTEDEIYRIILAMPEEDCVWIDNEYKRKERYKTIIAEGNRLEMVRLIKTLHQHQQKQNERGKKLHITDGNFLKNVERILYDEFALVLKINREQVLPLIQEQIQN